MATVAHPAVSKSENKSTERVIAQSNPVVLWHLLSLDAPTVAMLWTWFLARANHVRLPPGAVGAMGLAVWILYAADRLLDARGISEHSADLEPRHHFHLRHRLLFRLGIGLSAFALAALLPDLAKQSIRLYLILSALLFAYFILIHTGGQTTRRLPKELAVGIFFSAAVFIPTVAREPSLRLSLLPGAMLFAVVCSLNCLFIYAWEHPYSTSSAHLLTRFALLHLPEFSFAASSAGAVLAFASRISWPIPVACALTSALLLVLHQNRHRLGPTTLRAAADVCLLTPLLLLSLLRY